MHDGQSVVHAAKLLTHDLSQGAGSMFISSAAAPLAFDFLDLVALVAAGPLRAVMRAGHGVVLHRAGTVLAVSGLHW